VVGVDSLGPLQKLTPTPVAALSFDDTAVDLSVAGPESNGYLFAVYAYVLRAVNALGVESGSSPFALTIPSEPREALLREEGTNAHLRWTSLEEGIAGYRIYRLADTFTIVDQGVSTPNTDIVLGPFTAPTRFWVVPIDTLGQMGQPSSALWFQHSYSGFYEGDWHQ
jgi:hypothetical protein